MNAWAAIFASLSALLTIALPWKCIERGMSISIGKNGRKEDYH
jgi:hypothetical protein